MTPGNAFSIRNYEGYAFWDEDEVNDGTVTDLKQVGVKHEMSTQLDTNPKYELDSVRLASAR